MSTIVSGTYSQEELHEFIQVCYALALPSIRRKIALGKINLDLVGLCETDIVQDCLADLFRRDDSPIFPEINRFFDGELRNLATATDERILLRLRQLVLGKCHNSLIRIHSEADPVLGKIIRNVTLAIDRAGLFERSIRFGEACIMTRDARVLPHLPPIPNEYLRQRFLPVAHMNDTIPEMMKKLYAVLAEQEEYQRIVPLVGVALMFKEVYVCGAEHAVPTSARTSEPDDVSETIGRVVEQVERQMQRTYVGTGKRSARVFHSYMLALREVLTDTFVHGDPDGLSYFEYLERQVQGLTKSEYMRGHRSVFEYLAKTAKRQAGERLKKIVRDNLNV